MPPRGRPTRAASSRLLLSSEARREDTHMEVFAASLLSTALVVPARPAVAAAPIMQFSTALVAPPVARPGPLARAAAPIMQFRNPFGQKEEVAVAEEAEGSSSSDEEEWTLDKVAKLGLAGVLSIAVAESVFWILSFPISSIFYFFATGEWIDLFTQEGQVRAHTSVWGARRASTSPPPPRRTGQVLGLHRRLGRARRRHRPVPHGAHRCRDHAVDGRECRQAIPGAIPRPPGQPGIDLGRTRPRAL